MYLYYVALWRRALVTTVCCQGGCVQKCPCVCSTANGRLRLCLHRQIALLISVGIVWRFLWVASGTWCADSCRGPMCKVVFVQFLTQFKLPLLSTVACRCARCCFRTADHCVCVVNSVLVQLSRARVVRVRCPPENAWLLFVCCAQELFLVLQSSPRF
jgi:hypothetical protein